VREFFGFAHDVFFCDVCVVGGCWSVVFWFGFRGGVIVSGFAGCLRGIEGWVSCLYVRDYLDVYVLVINF